MRTVVPYVSNDASIGVQEYNAKLLQVLSVSFRYDTPQAKAATVIAVGLICGQMAFQLSGQNLGSAFLVGFLSACGTALLIEEFEK